jgi:hypothetical protein
MTGVNDISIPKAKDHTATHFKNLKKPTAHLFRNLAWKADRSSKLVLLNAH